MHRVGYNLVKSPWYAKKSKIAENFFMTKVTDLNTIFCLKPLNNSCKNMRHNLIFVLNKKIFFTFLTFFGIFSTLPNTQTIKVIDQFIFSISLALKNRPMNMHVKDIFKGEEARGDPSPKSIRSIRPLPCSLYRVNHLLFFQCPANNKF